MVVFVFLFFLLLLFFLFFFFFFFFFCFFCFFCFFHFPSFPNAKTAPHFEFFFGTDFNKTRYLLCFVDIPAPNLDICCVLYRPSKNHWYLLQIEHAKTLLFTACVCFLPKKTIFRSFLSYISWGQIRSTLWLKPQMACPSCQIYI